jgi:hypothetical protein
MSLNLKLPLPKNRYAELGLPSNPFPVAGKVSDVFVERREVASLDAAITRFLMAPEAVAGLWYLEGRAGTGKTNYLLSRQNEIKSADNTQWSVSYIPGTQLTPQGLLNQIVQAIGHERLGELSGAEVAMPEGMADTDLARAMRAGRRVAGEGDLRNAFSAFLARWLSGQQTYADEREHYGVWAKERLVPAVALPYLKVLFDALRKRELLTRLVLLIDELENVAEGKGQAQNEYFMSIKNLVNIFNFQGIMVILAGLPEARTLMRTRFGSLESRMTTVTLNRLQALSECQTLARAYVKSVAHDEDDLEREIPPTDVQRAVFANLSGVGGVPQRDFLAACHDWVESHVANLPVPRPKKPTPRLP